MTSELFAGQAPRLWLRIEQDVDKLFYARIPADTADGYILNANLVEHSPGSLATFLDRVERPFLIDPMSYRFERPSWYGRGAGDSAESKRNYSRLWNRYAEGVDEMPRAPTPGTAQILGRLSDERLLRYCANAIQFQDNRLRAEWLDDGARYAVTERLFGYQLAPAGHVAPYIVVGQTEATADIALLVRLAAATASLARDPVVAIVPMMPDVIADISVVRQLASGLARARVQTALLWPVGVTALALADSPELFTGLGALIRSLRDSGVASAMLYGGFFSTLLRSSGLSGFSHALMYGESRDLDPLGGRPSTRFYIPPLHGFYDYQLARQLLAGMSGRQYLNEVCGCDLCRDIVAEGSLEPYFQTYRPDGAKRDFPTSESYDLNRFHFLLARGRELEFARSRAEPELIRDLLSAIDAFPPPATRVLRTWAVRLRAA
jgi:hypothetical protein